MIVLAAASLFATALLVVETMIAQQAAAVAVTMSVQ